MQVLEEVLAHGGNDVTLASCRWLPLAVESDSALGTAVPVPVMVGIMKIPTVRGFVPRRVGIHEPCRIFGHSPGTDDSAF